MKKEIHPQDYRLVIFQDTGADTSYLIGSTVETSETAKWTDGNEYPLYKVEISSASHPFYTGNEKVMDTAGRVDKFKKRMEQAAAKPAKKKVAPEEPAPVAEEKTEDAPVADEVKEEVVADVVENTDTPSETATEETPAIEESSEEVAEATDTEEDKEA